MSGFHRATIDGLIVLVPLALVLWACRALVRRSVAAEPDHTVEDVEDAILAELRIHPGRLGSSTARVVARELGLPVQFVGQSVRELRRQGRIRHGRGLRLYVVE